MAKKAHHLTQSRPTHAKNRLAHFRQRVVTATSDIAIPAMLTLAEAAAALHVSKPTVARLVRRGELLTYRPTGAGGVVLVHAHSVADHVARHSYGGAR